jgi:Uma2 family endonuclease
VASAVEHPPAVATADPQPVSAEPAPAQGGELYRLSIAQYHQIAAAGIISDKAPVFLLEGLLVMKATKSQLHIVATAQLNQLLNRAVPDGWYISSQNPVTIEATHSEPEPDGKVVRGSPKDYRERRVGPTDTALVVEVADFSLRFDQTKMKATYARAGIPVYWIVNVIDRRIEVYTDPTGPDSNPDYRQRTEFGPEAEVPLVLDGREVARIAVRELLP